MKESGLMVTRMVRASLSGPTRVAGIKVDGVKAKCRVTGSENGLMGPAMMETGPTGCMRDMGSRSFLQATSMLESGMRARRVARVCSPGLRVLNIKASTTMTNSMESESRDGPQGKSTMGPGTKTATRAKASTTGQTTANMRVTGWVDKDTGKDNTKTAEEL